MTRFPPPESVWVTYAKSNDDDDVYTVNLSKKNLPGKRQAVQYTTIVFDPNIRPSGVAIIDRHRYRCPSPGDQQYSRRLLTRVPEC